MVKANLTTFKSRVHRKEDNLYWNADPIHPEPTHTCVECSQIGATVECMTHLDRMGRSGFAHATCYILQHQHICTQCQSLHAAASVVQLTPPSHACSDGSYNPDTGSVSCGFSATGSHDSLWCSIKAKQLSPPWLIQAKYRAAIRHLLRCMQTRDQPLKLRHILSHMEHTHTQTTRNFPYYAIV